MWDSHSEVLTHLFMYGKLFCSLRNCFQLGKALKHLYEVLLQGGIFFHSQVLCKLEVSLIKGSGE